MPDFDFKGQFPMAAVIEAAQRKAQMENQNRLQQLQLTTDAIRNIGGAVSSLADHKRRMAQAMVLGQNAEVQGMLTGGNRPVTSTPFGEVKLDQTASGDVNTAPVQNAQNLSPQQISSAIGDASPLDVIKAASDRSQKLAMTTDHIVIKDAAGNIVGSQQVTRPKSGKTIVTGPQPTPNPRPDAGDNAMKKAVVHAKVDLATVRPMVNSVIGEIDRVKALNDNSFGGKLGELQMKGRSASNVGTKDPKFVNTADIINTMQQQVARVLKSTFGGQLSDEERKYLNTIYGAMPSMSQKEREIAMTNVQRMLQSKLDSAQSTLDELSDGSGEAPPPSAPPPNPDLAHLSTKELLALRDQMTAHKKTK